jgi:phosphatidate phosphatase APP1
MRTGLLGALLGFRRSFGHWAWTGRRPGPPLIDPYLGYATPEHLVARGRLLSRLRRPALRDGQRRWRNALQMLSLFLTDEMAQKPVRLTGRFTGQRLEALSDEEGYFTLLVPRGEGSQGREGGWAEVEVEAGDARVTLPVQVPHPEARLAVVTDIDDTLIRTGAWTLPRNLWTTFTGNLATRHVFPDAVALLDRLSEGGRNPVFFVSSSPWNLHAFLEGLLAQAGVVRAPLFLRDLGIGEMSSLGGGHGSHKGSVIDRLMAANPDLPFWLIGDTGQKDAAVYADAAQRHPGRVARVVLRRAGRDADEAAVAALRDQGVTVDLLPDYAALLADWPLEA